VEYLQEDQYAGGYFGMAVGSGGVDLLSRVVVLFSNDVIIVCMHAFN